MKIIFIYVLLVLAISCYIWVNIFKEGNQSADMESIHKLLLASTDQDTNTLQSNTVTPGITSIDRYADPMCKPNEHIYCLDGKIECNDIFGGNINTLQTMAPYLSGGTLAGCGSNLNKINLYDYSTRIGTDIRGVMFDLSNCTSSKPWRVGGDTIQHGYGNANTIAKNSFTCYQSQSEADAAWNNIIDISLNKNAIYNVNDEVFVLASFLNSQSLAGLPQILKVLDIAKNETNKDGTNTSYTTINGQKYYYAKIYSINDDNYTIALSTINVPNVPKSALLKNSLYNPKTNDYYTNLKTGSYPRPVCKSGAFTSCLSSPPFTINNGKYVSTNDPILSVDASYNQLRAQSQIDLNANIPFSAGPVNPSGIIDNNNLLEYNYFSTDTLTSETPFIKCMSDYGSNIGDPLCCNQPGSVVDTKYICPQEVPQCIGYSKQDNIYGFCS